jgi:hypothetical protein
VLDHVTATTLLKAFIRVVSVIALSPIVAVIALAAALSWAWED